jgi:hypothetical protein
MQICVAPAALRTRGVWFLTARGRVDARFHSPVGTQRSLNFPRAILTAPSIIGALLK